jgi:predicted nucleic acid-binding protein
MAGLKRLPEGRRRSDLITRVEEALAPYRETQAILPFDFAAAEAYADILAERDGVGLPIHTADAQIAAICRVHQATCATRNSKDFVHTGVDIIDPWSL